MTGGAPAFPNCCSGLTCFNDGTTGYCITAWKEEQCQSANLSSIHFINSDLYMTKYFSRIYFISNITYLQSFFASFNSICSSNTFCISICQVSSCCPSFTFWLITFTRKWISLKQGMNNFTSSNCWFVCISSPFVMDSSIQASFFSFTATFLSCESQICIVYESNQNSV